MPVESKWRVFNHARSFDLGEMTVLSHRREGLEVYLSGANKVMTYPYPPNNTLVLDGDHIRICDPSTGEPQVTFAPVQ
jgi:hypothetical protein